ncbi:MAG: NAD(P)/FAD-dependent oxidoreductase [Treponema sp.]|jgi:2,4-dienoyl-CoA reductase-like NADH-dependent reductase (Old Yellow Enzyme family)/thioredoxin reductase|nr:NAD(P)/FAD-dependent oxidoreductase [Treponema sp.]
MMSLTTGLLFKPIQIGTMTVPNRFVMPPMGTNLANKDGSVSQRFIDYYAERARGGFGLITIEVTAVDPLGKAIMNEPGLWSDEQIEGYKRLVDACHQYGAKVSVQVHHCGRETSPDKIDGHQPVAVSSIPCPLYRTLPHELSTEEIYELVEKFGNTGRRARLAGADAVEVHGGHSYLIAQFTSECSNHRVDEFGGNFENRMRFSKLVIENIKLKAGNDYPILYRVSGEEPVAGGNTQYDTMAIARYVESCGIHAIHVTYGRTAGAYQWVLPPGSVRTGYSLRIAEEIKKVVNIPVISVGRHTEPYIAENAIRTGKADLISFGRQSMADPYLPNKTAGGKLNELIPCIACLQGCAASVSRHEGLACLANPFTGREGETRIVKTDTPKKVVVIGGGPAGLMASWICAKKGHEVICYEKTGKLGGEMRLAGHPPTKGNIISLVGNYITMCKNSGVKFVLNTEATEDLVVREKPNAVIISTGSIPLVPNIPGIRDTSAVNARDILDGKVMAGQKILIVGGGAVGSETADFLGEHARTVTLVEMLDDIALDEEAAARMYLMERLAKYGTKIITGAKVKKFVSDGVVCLKNGEEQTLTGFDMVILAMGTTAYNPLESVLKGKVKELYVVGDALKARKALEAIREAADAALKI